MGLMKTFHPLKLATLFVASFAQAFEKSIPLVRTQSAKFMMSSQTVPDTFKVLGVCGGIGSGKSSASHLLVSELGCLAHLDADSLAHSVYSPGSQAVKDIVAAFGEGILQESDKEEIDRKKLGAIVFSDRNEMEVRRRAALDVLWSLTLLTFFVLG